MALPQTDPDDVERDPAQSWLTTDPGPSVPATVWERPDYSDLEVCAVPPQPWESEKMPVVVTAQEKVHDGAAGSPVSPSGADPVPAYFPHRTSTHSHGPFSSVKGDYAEWDQRTALPEHQGSRFFARGMSKKRLSIVGVGILAFILILIATVLGVTLTAKIVSKQGDSSATSEGSLLENSALAAVNWTDYSGIARSAVFYQDKTNAIMVALRDSVSNQWTQRNVTASVMNTTGADTLDVLPGTPFATVSNRNQVSLYYLTTSHNLAEAWNNNPVEDEWKAGSLGTSLSPLTASAGSHLSAFWQLCDNCSNSLYVAFQDDNSTAQMANLTDSTWEFAATPDTFSLLPDTGLAVLPFTLDNGTSAYGTDPVGLRLSSFDSAGVPINSEIGPETNGVWVTEITTTAHDSAIANDTSPGLAAMTYGAHGLTKSLVNYLTPDGSIMSYLYNGSAWTSGRPDISGGPSKLTTIAATQDMHVYGIFDGAIYEFLVNSTDPLSWSEESVVKGA
ncbi:unnamed protein product [Discula destructiva]